LGQLAGWLMAQRVLASPIGYTTGSFGMELGNTPVIRLCARKILPLASGINQQRHVQLEFS
jgi:hypothetical protein